MEFCDLCNRSTNSLEVHKKTQTHRRRSILTEMLDGIIEAVYDATDLEIEPDEMVAMYIDRNKLLEILIKKI